jgi:hypothetical protein
MHGKKIEKEKRRPRRLIFYKILELVHVYEVLLVGSHIILLRSLGTPANTWFFVSGVIIQ